MTVNVEDKMEAKETGVTLCCKEGNKRLRNEMKKKKKKKKPRRTLPDNNNADRQTDKMAGQTHRTQNQRY